MTVYIFTPEDLLRYGSINEEQLELLKKTLLEKDDILIVGRNRSGKTKLVEALVHLIPEEWKIAVVTAYNEFKPFKGNIHIINTEFNSKSLERRTEEVIEQIKRLNPDYVIIDTLHTVSVPQLLKKLIDEYPFIITSLVLSNDLIGEIKHWLKIDEDTLGRFEIVVKLAFDFRTHSRSVDAIYRIAEEGEKVKLEKIL